MKLNSAASDSGLASGPGLATIRLLLTFATMLVILLSVTRFTLSPSPEEASFTYLSLINQ